MGKGRRYVSTRALAKSCVDQMADFKEKKATTYRDKQRNAILSGLRALKAPAVSQRKSITLPAVP